MRKICFFLALFHVYCASLSAQDMFKVRRLTFENEQEGFATWSPDGMSIVYQYTDLYDTLGKNGLWKVSPDGTGATQIFKGIAEHAKWSPDGKRIAFTRTRSGNFDIWIMELDIEKINKKLRNIPE